MSEIETRLGKTPAAGWPALREGVLKRADREALIDLAFERHETPFGTMLVVAGSQGIVRIALATEDEREVLDRLAGQVSSRIAQTGRECLTAARQQLDSYFAGKLRKFELPLDWQLTRGFRRDVLHQTAAIPFGSTASYSELAERAGSPRAVRAAGTALASNPLPIVVPCHRVLRSDGMVGSYLGGSAMKAELLRMERDAA